MTVLRKLSERLLRFYRLPARIDTLQEALGRIESRLASPGLARSLHEREFRVYSQWGEDGIIDYLVSRVAIADRSFVEFGVENYSEANTLFLLKHRHWRGLVIDGSRDNIDSIRAGQVLWRYDLHAECAFIDRDNVNELISRNGFNGDIGLLSVDIDGNDYWVWEAIECVRPRIVVSEYNSLFGPRAAISTPYRRDFQRSLAHRSKMYYGASIAALTHLARERGYSLVGSNSAGNNAFFVRDDCLGDVPAVQPEQAWVAAAFREARSPEGYVEHLRFEERVAAIAGLPVVDVISGAHLALRTALA